MSWFNFSREISEITQRNNQKIQLENLIRNKHAELQAIDNSKQKLNSEQQHLDSCDIETSKKTALQKKSIDVLLQSLHQNRIHCEHEISQIKEKLQLDATQNQQKLSLDAKKLELSYLKQYRLSLEYILAYAERKKKFMSGYVLGEAFNVDLRLQEALKFENLLQLKPIEIQKNLPMTLAAYLKKNGIYRSLHGIGSIEAREMVFINAIPNITQVLNTIKQRESKLKTQITEISKYQLLSEEAKLKLTEQIQNLQQNLKEINANYSAEENVLPKADISLFLQIKKLLVCETQSVSKPRLNEYFSNKIEQLTSSARKCSLEIEELRTQVEPLNTELREKIQVLVQRYITAIYHLKSLTLVGASLALVLSIYLGSATLLVMAGVTATYGPYQSSRFFKIQEQLQNYVQLPEENMHSDNLNALLCNA